NRRASRFAGFPATAGEGPPPFDWGPPVAAMSVVRGAPKRRRKRNRQPMTCFRRLQAIACVRLPGSTTAECWKDRRDRQRYRVGYGRSCGVPAGGHLLGGGPRFPAAGQRRRGSSGDAVPWGRPVLPGRGLAEVGQRRGRGKADAEIEAGQLAARI